VLELARPVIDIVPSSACVAPGDRRQFKAQVLGSGNQAVIWSGGGNSGRISPSGLFVAGTGEGTYTVRAAWEADRSLMSEIDVRVSPGDACLQVEYAGQLTGSWVFPKTHRTMLRVFTSTDLPAGACGIVLEMSSETEDYAILGGLLLGPLRAGSFAVRDARPQANAGMQVDSVGLQVKPACARIEPECQHGLPRDASTGGRFQIDRITPRSAAGSFDIDVETEKRRYRVYGSFALPLGNVVGMRLADKHPCLPR
jgi:hypothetical protein